MSRLSTAHIRADEDCEGRRPIRIGIVLHGGDKNFVHYRIGLEALDSLAKVLQSVFHLTVRVLLIDGIAGPLGCRINAFHEAENFFWSFWFQHGKCKVERG